ncbi:unnamed protein product [Onchocerca flexuosa]|uniref:DDE-1 domain-containing protein n=1 Tax=Onchocerca flexuosa TaxID=387005 RepID=A0A183HJC2_9BILA|nr:unnamed protein product [Onchocerca flexuosa]
MKVVKLLSSNICDAIENVHPILRKQLKKLILDGRVWGALSADHLAYIHNLLPNCTFEAELAPDDCKDLKHRRMYQGRAVKNSDDSESEGSGSSALDDGDEYLMRSDYSDSTEENNESRTFTELLTSKVTKKSTSFLNILSDVIM